MYETETSIHGHVISTIHYPNGKTKKTWEMLKRFTENKNSHKLKAYVVTESIKNDEYYQYEYISMIDGVFYWNDDLKKPFRLNSFYNPLEIDWLFKD